MQNHLGARDTISTTYLLVQEEKKYHLDMGDNDGTSNNRDQFTVVGSGEGHMIVHCTISNFSLNLKLFQNKHLKKIKLATGQILIHKESGVTSSR